MLENEDGLFTDNIKLGITAKQAYNNWLENKNKNPIVSIPLQEKNRADIVYLSVMTGVDL